MISQDALLSLFEGRPVAVADGGFATHLEDALEVTTLGDSPVWSASVLSESPQLIKRTHRDFLEAGAQIIGTATYQACHAGFESCGIDRPQAEALMRLSIELADEARSEFLQASGERGASDESRKPLIALSLGPYGAFLRGGAEYTGNYGSATEQDLATFHKDRLRVFAEASQTWDRIDVLAFETVPRLDEARAILTALAQLAADFGPGLPRKPAYISFVFSAGDALPWPSSADSTTAGSSSDGLKGIVDLLDVQGSGDGKWGLSGIGINCTKSQHLSGLVAELSQRLHDRIASQGPMRSVLLLEPDGGQVYDGLTRTWSSPQGEAKAASVEKWQRDLADALARTRGKSQGRSQDQLEVERHGESPVGPWAGVVLGGCCKATTEHIAALRRAFP